MVRPPLAINSGYAALNLLSDDRAGTEVHR